MNYEKLWKELKHKLNKMNNTFIGITSLIHEMDKMEQKQKASYKNPIDD
jgi:hypothetical protein